MSDSIDVSNSPAVAKSNQARQQILSSIWSKLEKEVGPEAIDRMLQEVAAISVAGDVQIETEDDVDQNDDDGDGEDQNALLNGVVRIYCTHSEPNFGMPWQRRRQESSTSSGFLIAGRKILTNAHAVEYGSLVQVKKRQCEKKYVANVLAVGHECDLAILTVDDEEFWLNSDGEQKNWHDEERNHSGSNSELTPLSFGSLPDLLDHVSVVGYPVGGDSISLSSGVVSRIEMQEYAQASAQLLAIQIDAAINPGNSGGPVVNAQNEVIGAAFQSLSDGDVENIGYVVPVTVIQHFLDDVQRHGKYSGVCSLGARLQSMDNFQLRRHFGMLTDTISSTTSGTTDSSSSSNGGSRTGVLVVEVAKLAPAAAVLRPGDVILSVDGVAVANDGTIPFRKGRFNERVQLSYYFTQRFASDSVSLEVLRRSNSNSNSSIDNGGCGVSIEYGSSASSSHEGEMETQLVTVQAPLWIHQPLIPRTLMKHSSSPEAGAGGGGAPGTTTTTSSSGGGSSSIAMGGVPSYLMVGGLVLVALCREYLESEYDLEHMGAQDGAFDRWADEFRVLAMTDLSKEDPEHELVLLSQVLAHPCNIGYENYGNMLLRKLNGIPIHNLRHLKLLVDDVLLGGDPQQPPSSLVFEFANGLLMVLDSASAREAQEQLCTEHLMPAHCSADLL